MDPRVLILLLPSLLVLGLLVLHSLGTLPRNRALAFWIGIVAYGLVRGLALRWAIDRLPGGEFPYAIRDPLFAVLGVALQEVVGWAIVAYLGWWLGARFSKALFVQVAWACVFLGAISWTIESAAVAAGWWYWTVPVTQPLLVNVPAIAIVDWAFVGIDFLLPFVTLTAPETRRRPWRFLTLLAFPIHFGAHAVADATLAGIPLHHLAHWGLLGVLLALALRSPAEDVPFDERRPRDRWPPLVGLAVVHLDVAIVEIALVHRPALLVSILPSVAVALLSLRTPRVVSGLLSWRRRQGRWLTILVLVALGITALQVHARGARRQTELVRRLDGALMARDRGDLEGAARELATLARAFPGSHVPSSLLGEIDYRADRLEQARARFEEAVRIKQDDVRGFRYLAVIDLRLGRKESAARFAAAGLRIDAGDPTLRYLHARALGAAVPIDPADPRKAQELAALAFEVGDAPTAATVLDRAIARWPAERSLYPTRVKLALHGGDHVAARRVAAAWLSRFPQDAEARQLSRGVEAN